MEAVYLAIAAAAIALILAAVFFCLNKRIQVDNPRMQEISGYIREGAMAFLKREYKVIGIFIAAFALLLIFLPKMGVNVAISFLIGAVFSVLELRYSGRFFY